MAQHDHLITGLDHVEVSLSHFASELLDRRIPVN